MLDHLAAALATAPPQQPPEPGVDNPVLNVFVKAAEYFIGIFELGGEWLMDIITGIFPMLIVLLTAVNALIKLIGPERIHKLGELAARPGIVWYPVRYLVFPFLSVFFFTNPMCYTMGQFLPERYKPAFYDSAVSFVHPITGLFPHANAGELFVYLGIAAGITQLGLALTPLAVLYLLVGMVVILIRGVVTEIITNIMLGRRTDSGQEATA